MKKLKKGHLKKFVKYERFTAETLKKGSKKTTFLANVSCSFVKNSMQKRWKNVFCSRKKSNSLRFTAEMIRKVKKSSLLGFSFMRNSQPKWQKKHVFFTFWIFFFIYVSLPKRLKKVQKNSCFAIAPKFQKKKNHRFFESYKNRLF